MINGVIRRRLPQRLTALWSEDWLYFLSYGVLLVTSLLSTSFYYRYFMDEPLTMLQAASVAMLMVYEYRSGFRNQNAAGMVVCGLLVLISLQISNGNILRLVPMIFLYTYCARNIHFARIARFSLYVSVLTVSFVVLSGYLGIIENVLVTKGNRVREYMGFRYALYLPGFLLNITGLWVYLNKKKPSILGSVTLGVINYLVYVKTDSRISFVLAEFILLAGLGMRYAPKLVDKVQALWGMLTASFAACAGGSLVMTLVYDSSVPWMRRLNSVLESRLSLGHRSLIKNGVRPFARHISWTGNGLDAYGHSDNRAYTYVDCMYVKVLQRYGIVFLGVFIAVATWAMHRLWKLKEYHILLICATVAAHCILDDLSFALHYNTFWIAMGTALLNPAALKWNT